MTKTRTRYSLIAAIATILLVTGCTVSYKFNGASIDYTKTKTITIRSFTNNAPLVYPALAPMFNESLRDIYAKQTRLTQVTNNGDIELEGEITGYDITPMSISDDAIAAETRLTITINVRYSNKA
ncbi:MAG: LptE family protein, partial [Paludibacteraceae bacterium]|nr:LptE family protein [Paludibacteraceae bacterium]